MQNSQQYSITAEVWMYSGKGTWHFITLTKEQSQKIKFFFSYKSAAFGTVRVVATIGKTSWKTSLFYDSKLDAYVLPIKADIRKKEKIIAGDTINVILDIQ